MFRAKGFILSLFTTALLLSGSSLLAQTSKVDVANGTYLTVSGNLSISSIITMSKFNTQATINFIEGSSWTGGSATRFLDGSVMVAHDNPFVFPIGSDQLYRPVAISGAARTTAAFFNRNPAKLSAGATVNKEVTTTTSALEQLNAEGYWTVAGERPTTLSFTYGVETNLDELTKGELEKLSIVGLRNGQWEVIPSSVDKAAVDLSSHVTTEEGRSSLIKGSISTNSDIIPSDYDYYTLAAVSVEQEVAAETTFRMYPNPSLTRLPLNINYNLSEEGPATLRVYSATGSLLAEQTLKAPNGTVSLTEVTNIPGTYTVSITDVQGNMVNQKLVVAAE